MPKRTIILEIEASSAETLDAMHEDIARMACDVSNSTEDDQASICVGGEGYFVEFNDDTWQSVFPTDEAAQSSLHVGPADALEYMRGECGVSGPIIVLPRDRPDDLT